MKGRALILMIICSFCAAQANAALVNRDLLGGLGDFEWSASFTWESHYEGSDYDWDSQTGEWYIAGDHKWGNNISKPDDSVAPGWMRSTDANVNPGTNIVYRIATGEGINGSNCQYFALKDLSLATGQHASAGLCTSFKVSNRKTDIHAGDHINFRIDQIRMSDFADLPDQVRLVYRLSLSWSGGSKQKDIPASAMPLQAPNNEVEATVDSDTDTVTASISIRVADGDLGSHQPGLHIDGAHLYIERAGSSHYEVEEVPVTTNRQMQTMLPFFDPYTDDIYQTARDYDRVMLKCEEWYWWALRLRYYNPDIKVYLYETTDITDMRASEPKDSLYSNCPFGFAYILQNHPEWLYAYTEYPYSFPDPREEWKQVNYYFTPGYTYHYFDRLDNPELQLAWRINTCDKATRYKLDGVFMDGPPSVSVSGSAHMGTNQAFIHSVTPELKSAGLDVIQNGCNMHLDDADDLGRAGRIYFDPSWDTGGNYTEPEYTANSSDNTSDGIYQEWGFFRPGPADHNTYSTAMWTRTLQDMETVARWNTATNEDSKKWIHVLVLGIDRPDDPAYGLDGWVTFGLSSYMLGQNEWSTFGCGTLPSYRADMDLDAASNLADPAGSSVPYNGDEFLRYRWYYGSDNASGGLVVANGDPDNNKQFSAGVDLLDETGRFIPATNTLTLKPHTGRILLNQTNYQHISSVQGPVEGEVVVPGTYRIKGNVRPNRDGLSSPRIVQIKVDDGKWKKTLVDGNGNWEYLWIRRSPGRHMIYTRTYLHVKNTEPEKIGRQVYCTEDPGFHPLDTIVDALLQPDGTTVWLQDKRVTATSQELPGIMYIQDVGISKSIRGVKVLKPATDPKITETGETVDVVGVMATLGGERCIVDAMVTSNDTLKIDLPVMTMPNMAIGGSDWNYNATTGAGQRGITGAFGANNIGMLVKTYGAVSSIDSSTFYVNDGSRESLKVMVPPGVSPPDNGSWVTVRGISSCEPAGDALNRLIRVRTQDDIQILRN